MLENAPQLHSSRKKRLVVLFRNANLISKQDDGRAKLDKRKPPKARLLIEEPGHLRSLLLVLMGERPFTSMSGATNRQPFAVHFVEKRFVDIIEGMLVPTAKWESLTCTEHTVYVRAEERPHPGPEPSGENLVQEFIDDLHKVKSNHPHRWDNILPGAACKMIVEEAERRGKGERGTPVCADLYDEFERLGDMFKTRRTASSRATIKDYCKVKSFFVSSRDQVPKEIQKRLLVRGNPAYSSNYDGRVVFCLDGDYGRLVHSKIASGPRLAPFLKHGFARLIDFSESYEDLEPWID